jgi:hypothetical protein
MRAAGEDVASEIEAFIRQKGVTRLPAAFAAESTGRLSDADRQVLHARAPVDQIVSSQQLKAVKRQLQTETDPAMRAELQRRMDSYHKAHGLKIAAAKRRAAAEREAAAALPKPRIERKEPPMPVTALARATAPALQPVSQPAEPYVIEKGIPVAAPITARGASRFPFEKMEIGDSFLVTDLPRKLVWQSAYTAGKRLGRTFVTRKLAEGIRIWRVA